MIPLPNTALQNGKSRMISTFRLFSKPEHVEQVIKALTFYPKTNDNENCQKCIRINAF